MKYNNSLINESSPYLLQHAHNPVNWFPWGQEALMKAKEENKLILVSIGYSACHWCHVMEHESFENEQVAEIMNKHFVCIKVDREERPDIDQIYMNAVQLMNGNGGWPLNCFTLPDQRPVYGGTYFRKDDWSNILLSLANAYKENPSKVIDYAEKLTTGIRNSELLQLQPDTGLMDIEALQKVYHKWRQFFDYTEGGYSRSPKFPLPNNFLFLLKYAELTKDESALAIVHLTLHKMAYGGIYDQLGGGFARYSVDEYWKIPHFEKMLYDNGQLIGLYAEAYQSNKEQLYKDVVYQSIGFVKRELTSTEFGFYSALDADSEGVEGKFYCWTKAELETLLGKDEAIFSTYYNCTGNGNFEHGMNNLFRKNHDNQVAQQVGLSTDELMVLIKQCSTILWNEREKRIRPGLDNKILASWNGLMLSGLIKAYRVFNEPEFLDLAIKNVAFMEAHLINKDGSINRNYANEKKSIPGFLDDYAFTIEALIELYQATFEERYLELAKRIQDKAIELFYDNKNCMFFYTASNGEALVARKMELSDQVIPASNSAMANCLHKLGFYFSDTSYTKISRQLLMNIQGKITDYPPSYSNWLNLLLNEHFPPFEILISGVNAKEQLAELDKHYLPNLLISGGQKKGKLPIWNDKEKEGIYICRNNTCQLPVKSIKEAMGILK